MERSVLRDGVRISKITMRLNVSISNSAKISIYEIMLGTTLVRKFPVCTNILQPEPIHGIASKAQRSVSRRCRQRVDPCPIHVRKARVELPAPTVRLYAT